MLQYHFYQTDSDGNYLHGTSFLLPDDEAAIAKAREMVDGCNVEVWKDQHKLVVIRPEVLSNDTDAGEKTGSPSP